MAEDNNTKGSGVLTSVVQGACAGLAATGPMTLFMQAAHRYLPIWQRSSLPPRKITMHLARRVGLKKHMGESQRSAATWIAHFGYGTAMGAVYGPLARRIPLPPVIKGTAYGLVVWAASYLAGLPILQVPQAARDQPRHRNLLMMGAHIVWGSSLGLAADLLKDRAG